MRKLSTKEIETISGGAIVVYGKDSEFVYVYHVYTNDMKHRYCSCPCEEQAHLCAEFYTSWENQTPNYREILRIT